MGFVRRRTEFKNSKRPATGKKIMLVDDDRGVVEVCTQILLHHGYEVETYLSGEEAIEAFTTARFDLVILDVGLPGIDGLKCAEEMLIRRSDIKILLSSGNCIDESVEGPEPGSSVRLLNKPFTMQELIHTVSDLMAA